MIRLGRKGQNLIGVLVSIALGSFVIYLTTILIERASKRSPDERFRVTLQEYRNAVLNRIMNDPESWALTVDAAENNPTPVWPSPPAGAQIGNWFWCVSRDAVTGKFRSESIAVNGVTSPPGECPSRVQRQLLGKGSTFQATPIRLLTRAGTSGSSKGAVFYDPNSATSGLTLDGNPCAFDVNSEGTCVLKPLVELVGIECDTAPFADPSKTDDPASVHGCTQPNFRIRLSFQISNKAKRLFPNLAVGRDYNAAAQGQDKYSAVLLVPAPIRRGCYADNRDGGSCSIYGVGGFRPGCVSGNYACTCEAINCIEGSAACPGGVPPAGTPLTLKCT